MSREPEGTPSVTRQLTTIISKLEIEKQTLQTENTVLKSDTSKLTAENGELKTSLQRLASNLDSLLAERGAYVERNASLEAELKQLNKENKAEQTKMSELESTLTQLVNAQEKQQERFGREMQELSSANTQLTAKLSDRTKSLEDCKRLIGSLQKELQAVSRECHVTWAGSRIFHGLKRHHEVVQRQALQRWKSHIMHDLTQTLRDSTVVNGDGEGTSGASAGDEYVSILSLLSENRKLKTALKSAQNNTTTLQNKCNKLDAQYQDVMQELADAQSRLSHAMDRLILAETELVAEKRRSSTLQTALTTPNTTPNTTSQNHTTSHAPAGMCVNAACARERASLSSGAADCQRAIDAQNAIISRMAEEIAKYNAALRVEESRRFHMQHALKKVRMLHPKDVDAAVALMKVGAGSTTTATPTTTPPTSTTVSPLLNKALVGEGFKPEDVSAFTQELLVELGAVNAAPGSSPALSVSSSLLRTLTLLQQRLDNTTAELTTANARQDRMRAEKAAVSERASRLAAENSDLEVLVSSLRNEISELQRQETCLQADVEVYTAMHAEVSQRLKVHEAEAVELREALRKKGHECEGLQENLDSVQARADEQHSQLQQQDRLLRQMEEHLVQLRGSMLPQLADAASAREKDAAVQAVAVERDDAREQLRTAEKTILMLRKALEEERSAKGAAAEHAAVLVEQLEALQLQCTSLSQEASDARSQEASLRGSTQELLDKLRVADETISQLKATSQEYAQALEVKSAHAAQLESNLAMSGDLLRKMEEMITSQTQSLSTAQSLLMSKDHEIDALRKTVDQLEASVAEPSRGTEQLETFHSPRSIAKLRSHLQVVLRQLEAFVRYVRRHGLKDEDGDDTKELHDIVGGYKSLVTATQQLLEQKEINVNLRTPPRPQDGAVTMVYMHNEDKATAPPMELQEQDARPPSIGEKEISSLQTPQLQTSGNDVGSMGFVNIAAGKLAAYEATIAQQASLISALRGSIEELKLQLEAAHTASQQYYDNVRDCQEGVLIMTNGFEHARQASERDSELRNEAQLRADKLANTLQTISTIILVSVRAAAEKRIAENIDMSIPWQLSMAEVVVFELLALLVPEVVDEVTADQNVKTNQDIIAAAADRVLTEVKQGIETGLFRPTEEIVQLANGETSTDKAIWYSAAEVGAMSVMKLAIMHAHTEAETRFDEINQLYRRNVGLSNDNVAVMSECLRLTEEASRMNEEIKILRRHLRDMHDITGQKESEIAALLHLTETFGRTGVSGVTFLSPRALGTSPTPRKQVQMLCEETSDEPSSRDAESTIVNEKMELTPLHSDDVTDRPAILSPDANADARPLPTLADLASESLTLDDLPDLEHNNAEAPTSPTGMEDIKSEQHGDSELRGRGAALFAALMQEPVNQTSK